MIASTDFALQIIEHFVQYFHIDLLTQSYVSGQTTSLSESHIENGKYIIGQEPTKSLPSKYLISINNRHYNNIHYFARE